MNSVTISGNLGGDPVLKQINTTHLCEFNLANTVREKRGDEWVDKTNWIGCKIWGKQAEWFAESASKGTPVVVIGELDQETWEKDGQKREKTKVKVSSYVIGEKRNAGNGGQSTPRPPSGATPPVDPDNDQLPPF